MPIYVVVFIVNENGGLKLSQVRIVCKYAGIKKLIIAYLNTLVVYVAFFLTYAKLIVVADPATKFIQRNK